jgi:hypothetical protein
MKKLLLMVLAVAWSGAALAAESQKLTFDVSGVVCGGCAKALAGALGEGGLKVEGGLAPGKDKKEPSRIVATADEGVDLGAAAAKVQKKEKPHPAPPGGLSLVLFATLDKDSAKKAVDAVSKLKGVDKTETKADEKKGEIVVRISGGEKLTANTLLDALKKDAGVTASVAKTKEKDKEKEKGKDKK